MLKNILFIFALLSTQVIFAQNDKPNDFLPMEFHKDRRDVLRDKMPTNSVAVLFSNPIRNRANDVDYIYHQDPNFYYLTGHREPHSVLLIFKDKQKAEGKTFDELIFVRSRDALREMYDGGRLGEAGAKEKLEIKVAFETPQFKDLTIDFSTFDKVLFYDFIGISG